MPIVRTYEKLHEWMGGRAKREQVCDDCKRKTLRFDYDAPSLIVMSCSNLACDAQKQLFRPDPAAPQGKPNGHAKAEEAEPETEPAIPVDIWDSFPPPALPEDCLPPVIDQYARASSRLSGKDAAAIAIACLVVCSAVIPDNIMLTPKVHDPGWTESARLWAMLVADPSGGKTPAMKYATWPLAKLDEDADAKYTREAEDFELLSNEAKKEKPRPKLRQILVNSTTVEACEKALVDNEHGLLVFADEISGFLAEMEKYSSGKGTGGDRYFWLQAYDGGSRKALRMSGDRRVPNLSVCLLGGVQPDRIRQIAAAAVDDGLLARFIPVTMRPGTTSRDEPQGNERSRYKQLIERLHMLRDPAAAHIVVNNHLKFSAEAQTIFYRVLAANEGFMALRILNAKLVAALLKGDGLFCRLCVTLHCIEHYLESFLPCEISADTARRAERLLTQFIRPHQLNFYVSVLGLSEDDESLRRIAALILSKGLAAVDNRIVHQGTSSTSRIKDADTFFNQLFSLGWLVKVTRGVRSNSPSQWTVNPAVHELFEERREQEKADREAAQAAFAHLRTGGKAL